MEKKIIGIVIGLALGFVAEKITEAALTDLGVNPRLVRIAGGVVGAIVS